MDYSKIFVKKQTTTNEGLNRKDLEYLERVESDIFTPNQLDYIDDTNSPYFNEIGRQ